MDVNIKPETCCDIANQSLFYLYLFICCTFLLICDQNLIFHQLYENITYNVFCVMMLFRYLYSCSFSTLKM